MEKERKKTQTNRDNTVSVLLREIPAHQPGPSAPSPGASPNRSPGAIRTQRRLRQGRSPPEAQRALQHGSAPRGDARDPAGTPLSPPPTPSGEPTSAGRLPAAASPRHHHPHSHLPEGTSPRCSEKERRMEGDPSGIAAAPYPQQNHYHNARRCSDCDVRAISPLIKPRWRRAGGAASRDL